MIKDLGIALRITVVMFVLSEILGTTDVIPGAAGLLKNMLSSSEWVFYEGNVLNGQQSLGKNISMLRQIGNSSR